MNRVVHFEIQANNPEALADFYVKVFGWKIEEWKPEKAEIKEENRYWLVRTGENNEMGINGGIMKRWMPISGDGSNAYICTVAVDNLDDMIEKVKSNGGSVLRDKMEVMKVGWLAYCKDTDGNIFGMMQTMPGAMEMMNDELNK